MEKHPMPHNRPSAAFVPAVMALALLTVLSFPTPTVAQEEADSSAGVRIVGTVVDSQTGQPVSGVRVAVMAGMGQRVTDDVGQFVYEGIELGVYPMILARPGYVTLRGELLVDRSGAINFEIDPVGVRGRAEDLEAEGVSRLSGEVFDADTGEPIQDVLIRLEGSGASVATDSKGRFRFERVDAGTQSILVERLGYETRREEWELDAGGSLYLRVPLATDPIPMEEIPVSVERRSMVLDDNGFYDRREQGQGLFLTGDEVRERSPQNTSDALQGLPGVSIVNNPYDTMERMVLLRGGRGKGARSQVTGNIMGCGPAVWIDGVKTVREAGGGPFRLDMAMPPQNIAGIEIYRSTAEVPPQYSGLGSNCGVIVIWSRQRYAR